LAKKPLFSGYFKLKIVKAVIAFWYFFCSKYTWAKVSVIKFSFSVTLSLAILLLELDKEGFIFGFKEMKLSIKSKLLLLDFGVISSFLRGSFLWIGFIDVILSHSLKEWVSLLSNCKGLPICKDLVSFISITLLTFSRVLFLTILVEELLFSWLFFLGTSFSSKLFLKLKL